MRGIVEVVQHKQSGGSEVVYRDNNMIVDGGKQTIVNMLTHIPAPSGAVDTYKTPDGSIFYLGTNLVADSNYNSAYFDSSSFLSSTKNSGAGAVKNFPPTDDNFRIVSDIFWGKTAPADEVALIWSSTSNQSDGYLAVSATSPGSDDEIGARLVLSSISCPSGYFYYVQADVKNGNGSIADKTIKLRQLTPGNIATSSVTLAASSNSGWATNDWFTVSGVYDFRQPTTGTTMCLDAFAYSNTSNFDESQLFIDNVVVRRLHTNKTPNLDEIGNYQIKAMTLGSAKQNFDAHDSRYGVQYNYTAASAQYLEMSGVSSVIFAKAPSLNNHIFDTVGNKGNKNVAAQLSYGNQARSTSLLPETQVEGEPEIKYSYTNAKGDTVDAYCVTKTKGQDYVIVDAPIPSLPTQPITLRLNGESSVPFEVAFYRRTKPNVPFSTAYEKQEYFNFERKIFTPYEDYKTVELKPNQPTVVSFDPLPQREDNFLVNLRSDFVARFILPRRYLYEKGFVALESIELVDSDVYSVANPTFGERENYLFNSDLSKYSFLTNAPDYLASSLGLVDFANWDVINPLSNSSNPIDEASALGSVTLYRNSIGETGAVLQASALQSFDLSACASISQSFNIPNYAAEWFSTVELNDGGMHTPIMTMSMDVYVASATSKGIKVSLVNESKDTYYAFRTDDASGYVEGEWGTNVPFEISEANGNAVSGEFVSVSKVITLPTAYTRDKFRIIIDADGVDGADHLAKYIVKNIRFGRLKGWEYGHQALNNNPLTNRSSLQIPGGVHGTGIMFSAVDALANFNATNGSNFDELTYIGQTFSDIDPNKKYNLIIDAEKQQLNQDSSIAVSLWHSDYTNNQNGESDVAKLIGIYHGVNGGGNNTGNLYTGYNSILNPCAADRKVDSYRGLPTTNPEYHNRDERAVQFHPSQFLYVPLAPNSKYTFSVDSARRELSATYTSELESNAISDSRDVGCYLFLNGPQSTRFYYNFSLKRFVGDKPAAEDPDIENYRFRFSKGGSPFNEIRNEEQLVYTPAINRQAAWILNDDDTFSAGFEFFTIAKDGDVDKDDTSAESIANQQCYVTDFSIRGNYPTCTDTVAHFQYNLADVPTEAIQPRVFFYDGDGTWTKIGTSESDLFAVSPQSLSGSLGEGIPSTEYSLSGNSQICIPIHGMNEMMGTLANGSDGTSFAAKGSATENSTYSLFLIFNKGCSVKINKVELVDVSLGAYGGPILSNQSNISTSEEVDNVPVGLVGGWHTHFVDPQTDEPDIPKIFVRDFSGTQFLGVSGSDTTKYQKPTICYSDYISNLGFTSKEASVAVDHWGGGFDSLYKAFQIYNTDTKERQVWDFTTNTWLVDNDNYPLSLSKYRKVTKPFKVPNESLKDYYPGHDWITSGISIPKWEGRTSDPRIFTVMFAPQTGKGQFYLRNLRFYSQYDYKDVSSVYPEFPNPEDTSIQPATPGTPGKLGHFLNNIEFYTSANYATGDKTLEEALVDGCYPPAEGILYMSGAGGAATDTPTTLYGNLNRFSVITPNGYILEQQRMPYGKSTLFDSSCGFVMQPCYDVYFSSTAKTKAPHVGSYGVFYLTDNLFSVSSVDVMGSNGNFEGGYLVSGSTNDHDGANNWYTGLQGRDSISFLSSITSGTNPNTTPGQQWAYASKPGDSRWSLVLSGDDDGEPANLKGLSYSFNQETAPSGYNYLAEQDVQFLGGDGLDQTVALLEQSDTGTDTEFLVLASDTEMKWLQDNSPNEFSSVSAVGFYEPLTGELDGHLQWHNLIYDTLGAASPANAVSSVMAVDNLSLRRLCAPGDDMAQPRVKYAITLSRDEWELLDKKYGGIESVGLHTMNLIETARKRGSERAMAVPPYLVSGSQYPFSSTMTLGDLAGYAGAPTPAAVVEGAQYRNSMCLRAKEEPVDNVNRKNVSRLFHTGFGSPSFDPSGWASGVGNAMTLSFKYKVVDDLGTQGTPKGYVSSPHFGVVELAGKQNQWQSFNKSFSIAASAAGENDVMWYFAKDQETSLAGRNEIRLDEVKLTNTTNGDVIADYNFALTDSGYLDNDVSAFSTDWSAPNFMSIDRVYDGAYYDSSLYTSEQLIENEPVFDLFAKKVFFPGGLKLGDNSDKLTIIWTLYF